MIYDWECSWRLTTQAEPQLWSQHSVCCNVIATLKPFISVLDVSQFRKKALHQCWYGQICFTVFPEWIFHLILFCDLGQAIIAFSCTIIYWY